MTDEHPPPPTCISGRPKYSETTAKLDAAIAKVQEALSVAPYNKNNPHLGSSYADLTSVIATLRSARGGVGLSISQPLWTDEHGRAWVTTRIAADGEWMEASFRLEIEQQKGINMQQELGVAHSYARRYALCSMMGVATGEDVDGHRDPPAGGDGGTDWRAAVVGFGRLGVSGQLSLTPQQGEDRHRHQAAPKDIHE